MTGCPGCLRSDGVYSARRLRHRDKPPPPAKARPAALCAEPGARLSINSDGAEVVQARQRVLSI